MKGMIFAAGIGSRLAPITDTMPKALVEVGGVPAIERVAVKMAQAGIRDIIVNVHHFADMVVDYVSEMGSRIGVNILISDESDLLLDTGGGLLKAVRQFGFNEPLLLHNADIMTDFDLTAMIYAYKSDLPDALLMVGSRDSSRKLLFDDDNRMRGWKNMTTGEVRPDSLSVSEAEEYKPKSFSGVHVLSPSLYSRLEDYSRCVGDKFSITPFYVDCCASSVIQGYEPSTPYHWWDIGRLSTLEQAREYYEKNGM
ncbi:MAG: sugar phosphate nucleotidyltransferase [Bacteroides sp.]|nr:sugar phosphate nucleotidyltransferase [Bacteroides sp.]MCM1413135.1 sugar phosphate nucleotidyltransferase [Bacteroides sp.]MCM1472123.1 sugar phosphate nucleotidyltransferase [Bacteroides sp.]